MLKKKVDGLEDYYYQWMNKYKDDADRRRELIRDLAAWYSDTANVSYRFLPIEMVERLEEELADA